MNLFGYEYHGFKSPISKQNKWFRIKSIYYSNNLGVCKELSTITILGFYFSKYIYMDDFCRKSCKSLLEIKLDNAKVDTFYACKTIMNAYSKK